MEIPLPPYIRNESLLKAIALDGAALLVMDGNSCITWASDEAVTLFDREDSETGLCGLNWNQLIQIDGESVWDSSLDSNFFEHGFLKIDGYCDAGKRGRIAIDLAMHSDGVGGRIAIIRDITDSKAREDELEVEKRNAEILNAALEREIAKANELAVMAERANIAKSVFLTSMSHEFRTPLNGVLGYAQILAFDESLNAENRKAAATIERCGQHLLSIINDVLDLSKIEAGKVEVTHDPVNLKNLITDVIDVFKVRASSKGLRLKCEYVLNRIDVEWIVGDSKLIRQILINLIGNAVKFTDDGSVTLRIEATPSDEEDLLSTQLRLSVIDTGPGIDRKSLQQIFEEFYQTEAFSGHKGGTGLGLAISRKLAKALGGELEVESKLGEGSSFHFTLPTRRIAQLQNVETVDDRMHRMRFGDVDLAYLQLFNQELDSGVMAGLMRSMGMQEASCYAVKQSLRDVNPEIHENWIVGVSAGGLLADNASELVEWSKWVKGKLVVLLYVDRSQSKCQSFMDSLSMMDPPILPVEIPINVVQVRETLFKQCEFFFTKTEKSAGQEDPSISDKNPVIGALSDTLPNPEVVAKLLKEARMGDMRGFSDKLDAWVKSIEPKTHFEIHVKQLVDGFKIDQLCRFLEETLYSLNAANE